MDFEGWEFLPDDEIILDYPAHIQKKAAAGRRRISAVLNMDYFTAESREGEMISSPANPRTVIPFQLDPITCKSLDKDGDDDHGADNNIITKLPIDLTIIRSAIPDQKIGPPEADMEGKSRVFFKKTNNNESVDISVTSPRSSSKGYVAQYETTTSPRKRDLVNKQTDLEEIKGEDDWEEEEEEEEEKEEEEEEENNSGGLSLWKWSLTGIGAICSFSVAAATICIIIFGAQQGEKNTKQNKKLKFQIYADDKRIKQVVHHATKLNEAFSAARGVPFNRAHISFGGYYEGI